MSNLLWYIVSLSHLCFVCFGFLEEHQTILCNNDLGYKCTNQTIEFSHLCIDSRCNVCYIKCLSSHSCTNSNILNGHCSDLKILVSDNSLFNENEILSKTNRLDISCQNNSVSKQNQVVLPSDSVIGIILDSSSVFLDNTIECHISCSFNFHFVNSNDINSENQMIQTILVENNFYFVRRLNGEMDKIKIRKINKIRKIYQTVCFFFFFLFVVVSCF